MFLGSKYNSVKAYTSNLSLAILAGKLLNKSAKYCLINVPKSNRSPLLDNSGNPVAFFFFRKFTFHAMQRLPVIPIVDIGSVFCVTILALCTSNESFFQKRPRTIDVYLIYDLIPDCFIKASMLGSLSINSENKSPASSEPPFSSIELRNFSPVCRLKIPLS